jgi:hypothetical protein
MPVADVVQAILHEWRTAAPSVNDSSCESFAKELARRLPGVQALTDLTVAAHDERACGHGLVLNQGAYDDSEHFGDVPSGPPLPFYQREARLRAHLAKHRSARRTG